jgi:hypothetical protein
VLAKALGGAWGDVELAAGTFNANGGHAPDVPCRIRIAERVTVRGAGPGLTRFVARSEPCRLIADAPGAVVANLEKDPGTSPAPPHAPTPAFSRGLRENPYVWQINCPACPGAQPAHRAGFGTKSRTGHRSLSRSPGTGPAIRHSPVPFPLSV